MSNETKPLTDEEIQVLRELAVSSQRTKWLVAGMRQIAIWIAAIGAGWLALKGLAIEMLWGVPR